MEFTDSDELRRDILANQYLPEHLRERAKNDTSEYCRAEDADNLLEVDRLTGNGLIRFYMEAGNGSMQVDVPEETAEKTKTTIPECPSGNLTDIRAMTKEIDGLATAYSRTVSEVADRADAVNGSKLDKIVADATKILNDSKGRVEDDKVRAALEDAIRSRDGKAISDAVKAVNDSIKAKSDADAKAKAEKEEQAADNAAQAQADNSGSYMGGTTGGYTGYTGGGYTQSQGGGGYTYTPQQSTGGSTGGGYTPTPQPQPAPQPSQGGGGDDGYEDICWAVDTSGKPGVQVPCS